MSDRAAETRKPRRESPMRVILYRGSLLIYATDEHDARMQTIQALAEDPSLLEVTVEVDAEPAA